MAEDTQRRSITAPTDIKRRLVTWAKLRGLLVFHGFQALMAEREAKEATIQ